MAKTEEVPLPKVRHFTVDPLNPVTDDEPSSMAHDPEDRERIRHFSDAAVDALKDKLKAEQEAETEDEGERPKPTELLASDTHTDPSPSGLTPEQRDKLLQDDKPKSKKKD